MKINYEEVKNEFKDFTEYYLPKIYSFNLPYAELINALKVGDTYRPVAVRLDEWRKKYPNLNPVINDNKHLAIVNDNVFFRDYEVHKYIRRKTGKRHLDKSTFDKLGLHYSQEFYDGITAQDINDALSDIVRKYDDPNHPYEYYLLSTRGHERTKLGDNTEHWEIRENQQEVINNFKKAYKNGRTNLLMYAVMRFGKSFTALCCAKEIQAKFVVVVSGKADVEVEWQNNVQKPDLFKNFIFKNNEDLIDNPKLISNLVKENSGKTIVLFLTLQNISQFDKHTHQIKERLKELFNTEIDLLIIDETHFAARANVYGSPLKENKLSKDEMELEKDDDANDCDINEANKLVNNSVLKAKIKLHLSGTPYQILADTEFDDEDIIARCQYSDIIEARDKWDSNNSKLPDSERKNDWENPYYGFPTMIRFAFNLPKNAKDKLEALKSDYNSDLSELFMPLSVKKDDKHNNHKKFKYENEVLSFLKAIDGTEEDDEILPFLDFEPIQNARMCKHLVFVLPRIASCDAMETLLDNKQTEFNNLKKYKIVNVSGYNGKANFKNCSELLTKLKQHDEANELTITLTVNRFLTGSTVPYWDTMVFLKGTHSAQEYDQAIFRLQSSHVVEYVSNEGKENEDIIKFCKKPQTLLVDFDLNRMLTLQNQKTLIYNYNNEEKGNEKLQASLEKELNLFSILYLNGDKLVKATANDVMKILADYSKNRSAIDEVYNIPIDTKLFSINEIKSFIELESPINSKNGPEFNANVSEEESDIDINEDDATENNPDQNSNDDENGGGSSVVPQNEELNQLANKLRTYYLKLLFYAYLTDSKVDNLSDVIKSLEIEDNKRIAKNLNIKLNNLIAFKKYIYFTVQNILDNKISNLNHLANDDEAGKPFERSLTALTSFIVMSPTEHVTPLKIAVEMLNKIEKDNVIKFLKEGKSIVDIGCKSAEFILATYMMLKDELDIGKYKKQFYAIPTSKVAYEFTRKIYNNLNLPVGNISSYSAYDLVCLKDEHGKTDIPLIRKIIESQNGYSINRLNEFTEGENNMKIGAIVGNPPYQGNRMQIYPDFYLSSIATADNVCLIFPQGWLEPKDGSRLVLLNNEAVKADKQIVLIDKRENVFAGFPGAKSTNIVVWKKGFDNGYNGLQKILTEGENPQIVKIPWDKNEVVKPQEITDIGNLITSRSDFVSVDTITTGRKPFPLEKGEKLNYHETESKNDIKVYSLSSCKFLSRSELVKFKPDSQKLINSFKVYIPYAWGNWSHNYLGGAFADIFVGYPGTMCSEDTFLVAGPFDTYDNAYIYAKYLMTHFARALLLVNKFSQHSTTAWHAIPMQDFHEMWWDKSISDIDDKLFEKYNISGNIENFCKEKIQTKSESSIKDKE